MTDLEIVRLCAEAMGLRPAEWAGRIYPDGKTLYDPLHNDAQAMSLVKKFRMFIEGAYTYRESELIPWKVEINDGEQALQAEGADLNRVICECVAKMESSE